MKHAAEGGDVFVTQGASNLFHYHIASRVGVPNTLALDQFDALLLDRHPIQGFDNDFTHGASGPTGMATHRDCPTS